MSQDIGPKQPPRIVGAFIKEKRQAKGLSQRALGQMLVPPVTTQFISNIERGVTPLPADHVQKVIEVLEMREADLLELMEQEYAAKLSIRVGHHGSDSSVESPTLGAFRQAAIAFSKSDPAVQARVRALFAEIFHIRLT